MLTIYRLLFALVVTYSHSPAPLVHSQDDNPPGFLSIDCGLPEGSDYTDSTTGIYYKSDANLIDSGESKSLSPPDKYRHLSTLRSFPRGTKNCYTIQPSLGKGNRYLIRATFMYGNYDSLNQSPTFDLNLGPDTWSKIAFQDGFPVVRKEIIHILSSDYIHVCLIKTGTTTPFISALELRPLNGSNSMYNINSGSLQTISRVDCGSVSNNIVIRYPNDIYDRRWVSFNLTKTTVSTSSDIDNGNDYLVPVDVWRTASTPDSISDPLNFYLDLASSDPLNFYLEVASTSDEIYIYMHFAEVEKLANQSREFNIDINGQRLNRQLVVPVYQTVTTFLSERPMTGNTRYEVVIRKTERSTLPPIVNGYEIYRAKNFSNSGTNETDVAAIRNIKSTYRVMKDSWQGDPCEPEEFLWDGLKCSYQSSDHSDRIISLNLSTSGLTGEILPSIVNLTQLETLDLSDNNLSGQIPGFLSQLAFLRVLNLKGNNFIGPVPPQLLENKEKGTLSLSYDDSHRKSNMSTRAVVGAVVGAVVVIVLLLAAILFGMQVFKKPGKQPQVNIIDIERKNRQFTYSQVADITRNFHRVLGEGGFGKVYHGYVGDIEVAVKMLSPSSTQGHREFQTEAILLTRIHHKNLISLVGYCNEDTHMGLIYEYMDNGSLDEYLSGKSNGIFSWKNSLQIALDAAQGLQYLHHECPRVIIHRDVKPGNILLNEQLQAKLGDFGLSKAYPAEGGTHVSTVHVAGTAGYIDPDYNNSNRLTEKSDVFSFGVVLLVMITGRPPTSEIKDVPHIAEWVECIFQKDNVTQLVYSRYREDYDVSSVGKAVELALSCTSRNSSARPKMDMVLIKLKECLAIETGSHDANPNDANPNDANPESSLIPSRGGCIVL